MEDKRALAILQAIIDAGNNAGTVPAEMDKAMPVPFRIESGSIQIKSPKLEMWAEKRETVFMVQVGPQLTHKKKLR